MAARNDLKSGARLCIVLEASFASKDQRMHSENNFALIKIKLRNVFTFYLKT